MQFKVCLTLGLAGLATAAQNDMPAVKGAITSINNAIVALDKSIQGITAANVATQMTDVTAKMTAVNTVMAETSAKLKNSKPLGVTDLMSIQNVFTPISTSMSSVLTDLMKKREFIVKGNQSRKLGEALKSSQNGLNGLSDGIMAQMPASMTKGMPKPVAPTAAETAAADKMANVMYDIMIAIFEDKETMVKIPAGVLPMTPGSKKAKKRSVSARYV